MPCFFNIHFDIIVLYTNSLPQGFYKKTFLIAFLTFKKCTNKISNFVSSINVTIFLIYNYKIYLKKCCFTVLESEKVLYTRKPITLLNRFITVKINI
jgi:hypothetical protein